MKKATTGARPIAMVMAYLGTSAGYNAYENNINATGINNSAIIPAKLRNASRGTSVDGDSLRYRYISSDMQKNAIIGPISTDGHKDIQNS
jgi:hypothetical protein